MGGYIRFDKDLADDPSLMSAAEILARDWTIANSSGPLSAAGNRVTLRHALRGVIVTLWTYADTHIFSDDSLRVTLDGLAAIVSCPVAWLKVLPEKWLRVRDDGYVVLPNYCWKNQLRPKDLRHADLEAKRAHELELNAKRQRDFRKRRRNARHGANTVMRNAASRMRHAPTGTGTGPLDPTGTVPAGEARAAPSPSAAERAPAPRSPKTAAEEITARTRAELARLDDHQDPDGNSHE